MFIRLLDIDRGTEKKPADPLEVAEIALKRFLTTAGRVPTDQASSLWKRPAAGISALVLPLPYPKPDLGNGIAAEN